MLVPGEDLARPHTAPREDNGDLVVVILGHGHLPPHQLWATSLISADTTLTPLTTYHDHIRQVGAKQTRLEVFPVRGVSRPQILGINLKSNSISKNNILNVKAFPLKGEKRNNLKHLV